VAVTPVGRAVPGRAAVGRVVAGLSVTGLLAVGLGVWGTFCSLIFSRLVFAGPRGVDGTAFVTPAAGLLITA